MLSTVFLALSFTTQGALAFPWVPSQRGVESSLFRRQQPANNAGSAANCPFNSNHTGAAPWNPKYPYNSAQNGLPGLGLGGFLVPALGDTAHQFVAPDYSKDIRGPCPALNTMANHNFLSHDGITTFNELVDAQQNVFNVGYDLATLLAVIGVNLDGDVATQRLSIGCDATTRTSASPALTGSEPGLDGHNKFEGDSSLARNDFFTHNGDDFSMNATLFGMMANTCQNNFNREGLSLYRYQRYHQSLQENPNFFFGPLAILLYAAAVFVYELFPSGTRGYAPDLYTISSFFGAEMGSNGKWKFNGKERIPPNWTNRTIPLSPLILNPEAVIMYLENPVLFGGNTGNGQFDLITGNGIVNGKFNVTSGNSILCLLYQATTEAIPSSLNSIVTPSVAATPFALSKLTGSYANLGCPRH